MCGSDQKRGWSYLDSKIFTLKIWKNGKSLIDEIPQKMQSILWLRNELEIIEDTNFGIIAWKRLKFQDILHTRVQTSAIIKIEFEYKDIVFHMYDVGGHRPERKKVSNIFVFYSQIQFERKFADLENSIMKHFLYPLYLLYFVLRTDHNDFFNFKNSAFVYRNCFLLSFLCYPSF